MKKSYSNMNDIFILLAIGLVAGALSGMVGIGGGIIIVPALVYFFKFSQQEAQGTTLAMFLLPIGILGAYNYYKEGHMDVQTSLIICSTFVVGSYFGSKIAISLNQDMLRKIFGIIILLLSLKMIFTK